MDSKHSSAFVGDNTMGSTLNQGNVRAGGNLHLGNNNTYIGRDEDKDHYKECLRELLSSLPVDPRDYKESLITRNGRWLSGTCEWLLKTTEYQNWRNFENTAPLLWITGDPGKGKTMLSLFLINYRARFAATDPEHRKLIYFFCGAEDGRNTGVSILRGLIFQLLDESKDMFEHVTAAYKKHGRVLFKDERFETLWRVFDSMVRDKRLDSVTCIIDGLDECIEESLSPLWIKIRNLYLPGSPTQANRSQVRLRLIVTSRNYPESFENYLHTFPRLKLGPDFDAEIKTDIEKYIDHRMEELACAIRKKPSLHQLRTNVKQKLMEGSNGTYLWVKFAINSLKRENCPELEEAVSRFPKGLDGMYTRMLLSIYGPKREHVISILRWVAVAFRPLTLAEVGTALNLPQAVGQNLEDATKDFVEYAGDLLLVISKNPKDEKSDRIVVPVHSSVTDFLWSIDASQAELALFRLEASVCHSSVAHRTLDYAMTVLHQNLDVSVSHPEDAAFDAFYKSHPLFHYSLLTSLRHLLLGSSENVDLSHALFDVDNAAHQPWLRAQCYGVESLWVFGSTTLVHVAALLGHTGLIKHCIKVLSCNVDVQDDFQRTPLFYAVLRERSNVVRLLLGCGANVNAHDFVAQQPLHIACAAKSAIVVTDLLAAGAAVNSYSLARDSSWGSDDPGSILDADDIVGEEDMLRDGRDHTTGTPLHFAAEYNRDMHVKLLLNHGAEINAVDEKGRTALHRTAMSYQFHPDSAKSLIIAGADMFLVDENGETAFHVAARDWNNDSTDMEDVMKVMLKAGYPVDFPTTPTANSTGGVTALQIASQHGSKSLVDELIRHGADVNHRDNDGRTALHYLAHEVPYVGNIHAPQAANTLLRSMEEATIFAKDLDGSTALELALKAEKEHKKIIATTDSQYGSFIKAWHAKPPIGVSEVIENWVNMIVLDLPGDIHDHPLGISPNMKLWEIVLKKRLAYRERMRHSSLLGG